MHVSGGLNGTSNWTTRPDVPMASGRDSSAAMPYVPTDGICVVRRPAKRCGPKVNEGKGCAWAACAFGRGGDWVLRCAACQRTVKCGVWACTGRCGVCHKSVRQTLYREGLNGRSRMLERMSRPHAMPTVVCMHACMLACAHMRARYK
eukprot:366122-Chlamydomonas_euryale.AAC.12